LGALEVVDFVRNDVVNRQEIAARCILLSQEMEESLGWGDILSLQSDYKIARLDLTRPISPLLLEVLRKGPCILVLKEEDVDLSLCLLESSEDRGALIEARKTIQVCNDLFHGLRK